MSDWGQSDLEVIAKQAARIRELESALRALVDGVEQSDGYYVKDELTAAHAVLAASETSCVICGKPPHEFESWQGQPPHTYSPTNRGGVK